MSEETATFQPMTDEDRRAKLRQIFELLEQLDLGLPMDQFEAESVAVERATEALKDGFDQDYVSTCEGCSDIILAGDQGHRCLDGELLCKACTPSWDDVKSQWDEGRDGDGDEDRARAALTS